jgi:hypothetical protein
MRRAGRTDVFRPTFLDRVAAAGCEVAPEVFEQQVLLEDQVQEQDD